jgi:hypothetical protein
MAEKRVGAFGGEDVFVGNPERVEILPKGGNIAGRSHNIDEGFWIPFMVLRDVQRNKYLFIYIPSCLLFLPVASP